MVSPSLKFFLCTLLRCQENGRGRKKKLPMCIFLVCWDKKKYNLNVMLLFQLLVGEVWLKISLWSLELDSFFVVVVFIFGKTFVKLHTFIMHAAISCCFSQWVNMKRVKMSMHNKCMGLWGNLKFSSFLACAWFVMKRVEKKNFKIASLKHQYFLYR